MQFGHSLAKHKNLDRSLPREHLNWKMKDNSGTIRDDINTGEVVTSNKQSIDMSEMETFQPSIR